MKVSLNWMREFAPIESSPSEVRDILDDIGLVVESVTSIGAGLDRVVVCQVLDISPIEGADKIRKITVTDGSEKLQIVCGAWNFAVGDKVPLAKIGAILPGGFEIARRKMKNVESNGMLCSAQELDLEKHGIEPTDGILVLDSNAEVGRDLVDELSIVPDTIFELELEPNRPDAMSIAGVARDIAARLKIPFRPPWVGNKQLPSVVFNRVDSQDFLVNHCPDLADRFGVWILDNVKVVQSPQWLKQRLISCGQRPINSVVDVSNYIMLEIGQPTHPYDRTKLRGGGLVVRRALPAEKVVTLDSIERTLGPIVDVSENTDDCVICDSLGSPVGIAGIMGGYSSQIDAETSSILLEAAHFSPMAIARTSKRLGLRTDASVRFERGCDPNAIELAAIRFIELLESVGSIDLGKTYRVDFDGFNIEQQLERLKVHLRPKRLNQILGTEITPGEVIETLESIDFTSEVVDDEALEVAIPTFRPDCDREIDLIEEVIRIKGYSTVERRVPSSPFVGALDLYQKRRRQLRQVLALGAKASEAATSSLVDISDGELFGLDYPMIGLENPLSVNESHLRASLVPGLVRAIGYNLDRLSLGNRLFEIGHLFVGDERGKYISEYEALCVVFDFEKSTDSVRLLEELVSIYRTIVGGIGSVDCKLEATSYAGFVHGSVSSVTMDGVVIGKIGEIEEEVCRQLGVRTRSVGALEILTGWKFALGGRTELTTGLLTANSQVWGSAWIPSPFPSAQFDLAFVVDEAVASSQITSVLTNLCVSSDLSGIRHKIQLYDVYRDKSLPKGTRSLTYSIRLEPSTATLSDDEIAKFRQELIASVEKTQLAKLRLAT